jgi:hypothetical protein
MRGFEKNFFDPSYVPRQGERARSKKFVWPVSHFLHQNETTAG